MKCLILAGGFATRLYPLTVNKAKALLEYKGKPVITHVVNKIPQDVDILVTTNRKFESDFRDWHRGLNRTIDLCIEEAVSDEQKKGAVGAIDYWIKTKNIYDDLAVIAADNYFEFDLSELMGKFNGKNVVIAAYDVGDKDKACELGKRCQLGLIILKKDRVVKFDEKPEIASSSIVSTGIYILPSRVFPSLSKYCSDNKRDNMGSFISYLISIEKVYAYVFSGAWVDIGDEINRGRLPV
jgi:glucose-1-phosphate thymidylyltransferase